MQLHTFGWHIIYVRTLLELSFARRFEYDDDGLTRTGERRSGSLRLQFRDVPVQQNGEVKWLRRGSYTAASSCNSYVLCLNAAAAKTTTTMTMEEDRTRRGGQGNGGEGQGDKPVQRSTLEAYERNSSYEHGLKGSL